MTFIVAFPGPVTNLVASSSGGIITLSWTAPDPSTATPGVGDPSVASYKVYKSTTSGGESSSSPFTGITTTSFIDSAVVAGTSYYYTVTAVGNDGGEGVQSIEVSVTPAFAIVQSNTFGVPVDPFAGFDKTPPSEAQNIQQSLIIYDVNLNYGLDGRRELVSGTSELDNLFLNLIKTPLGYNCFRPNVGSVIWTYIQEPKTPSNAAIIRSVLLGEIEAQISRVAVQSLTVTTKKSGYSIVIGYVDLKLGTSGVFNANIGV